MPKNQKIQRDERGFTLTFAVILCVIFAGLLYTVFYFLKINTRESNSSIYKKQAKYLAESGNNRAMSRLNVKTLPEIDLEDFDEDLEDEDDDFDDDDFFDEDFFEDFDDEDFDDDFFEEDDREFLSRVPRYVNFYFKNPFYVNIDTGQIIDEGTYYSLVQEQQTRIQFNRRQAEESGEEFDFGEILVEELFFPLPEVNVQKIGNIPIKKGTHLKPGFKIVLANQVPVKLKQDSIVDQYYNYVPEISIKKPKPILRNISPNYASQGEYLDVYIEGENLEEIQPQFGSSSIVMFDSSEGLASIAVTENGKPGRVELKIGPNKTWFYIIPKTDGSPSPIIERIIGAETINGSNQFTTIKDKQKIQGLKILGENLTPSKQAPVIVPDAAGITINVTSFSKDEIVFDIETNKVEPGAHYLSIFTEGGQSRSWLFNVEKSASNVPEDPFLGTYSTLITLLEVNSLSNLPFSSLVEGGSDGRPTSANNSSPDSGRPGGNEEDDKQKSKGFDLLKSDLELVWKLETVATVNKYSYKETRILRRSVPRIEAGITTNTEISFGQSSIIIEGLQEALTLLEEPSSRGDTKIIVEGDDPELDIFGSLNNNDGLPETPTGGAVVEDFGFGKKGRSPSARGFKPGGIVSIVSTNRTNSYSDFSFIKSLGDKEITVADPGFKDSHFVGDELIQFTPAINSPEPVKEREAGRSLSPPGSAVSIPGKNSFDYVFRTKFKKLSDWGEGITTNTTVPELIDDTYEGYFGLTMIEGVPSYTGSNSLYGQGVLIIDTTEGGQNPNGSTVTIGGSKKLPSIFEGVIYIIGNLQISGPVEISGGIVVESPNDGSTMRISGSGNISYSENAVKKSIIHIPFTEELRTRDMVRSKGQQEILEGNVTKK